MSAPYVVIIGPLSLPAAYFFGAHAFRLAAFWLEEAGPEYHAEIRG